MQSKQEQVNENSKRTDQADQQERYQVAIIGSGPGGYVAAIAAAQLGLKTVVVEKSDIGGTCLNRGCIPTKTMVHTAELYEDMQRAELFGLLTDGVTLDFKALKERKENVVATLRQGVEDLLAANGVDVMRGHATVLSPMQVLVEAEGGEETISTENIIIAAGTTPEMPQIEGIDLPGVYNSDTILEEIPAPKRLAVLGGGVIGMEFANIYASYGTEVTVLITSDRALRSLDRELGQSLSMEMKKKGAAVITRATVTRIEQGGPLKVVYHAKDNECILEVDAVLVAKGRSADLANLLGNGFELELDRGCIAVDDKMRTSVPGIYAIGDISNAGPELAHAASAEGILAVHAIAGEDCTRRLDLVPECVYTSPEIACVGLTEAAAKEAGIQVKTGKYPMGSNGKTLITDQGRSFIKIVADQDNRVVGAQLMCARATDIIGELALGIAAGMTVSEMLEVARPHPTFEEAVGEALESVMGTSIHSMPRRR